MLRARNLVVVALFVAALAAACGTRVPTSAQEKQPAEKDPFGAQPIPPPGDKDPFGPMAPNIAPAKPEVEVPIARPKAPPLRTGKKAIEEALEEKTDLEFIETPLKDFIDYVKDRHKVEIQFSFRALKDAGIDSKNWNTCLPTKCWNS